MGVHWPVGKAATQRRQEKIARKAADAERAARAEKSAAETKAKFEQRAPGLVEILRNPQAHGRDDAAAELALHEGRSVENEVLQLILRGRMDIHEDAGLLVAEIARDDVGGAAKLRYLTVLTQTYEATKLGIFPGNGDGRLRDGAWYSYYADSVHRSLQTSVESDKTLASAVLAFFKASNSEARSNVLVELSKTSSRSGDDLASTALYARLQKLNTQLLISENSEGLSARGLDDFQPGQLPS